MDAREAWQAFDTVEDCVLSELSLSPQVFEIRVSGSLRYELRRPVSTPRVDVVVDRDPEGFTGVTVYLNGVQDGGPGAESHAHAHVIDPGYSGPDHEWYEAVSTPAHDVPRQVRAAVVSLADAYHRPENCEQCQMPAGQAVPARRLLDNGLSALAAFEAAGVHQIPALGLANALGSLADFTKAVMERTSGPGQAWSEAHGALQQARAAVGAAHDVTSLTAQHLLTAVQKTRHALAAFETAAHLDR
ncbi:hypothetical protein ACIG3E_33675 [Streptomyces sp. NPDC053474]|uniref:hypothetical protein n=1 Tax=Streptomyces sp. NPDC053474 TaxID=3365704 RepID=UPI0037D50425